ncbi:MAG: UPF0164 family protein [Elusimicrobia bacterium]|nr:UPF0164 family protein [Elusimicrobiota bacterium]
MRRSAALAVAAGLLCGAPASAAVLGGRPGAIFDFVAAGRGSGMGGAYTALADDASSVYYNPAGLGRMTGNHLSLMHASLFEGAAYDYMGFARQGRFGGYGLQFLKLGIGGLDGRDALNQSSGGFEYAEQGLSLAYGTRLMLDRALSVGTSVKMLKRSLGPASNSLLGVDAGVQYQGPWFDQRVRLGLMAANVFGSKMGDTDDKLPMLLRAGVGMRVAKGLVFAGTVGMDGEFAFGTEYAFGPTALRVGLRDQNPTFGAGIAFRQRWSLDIAFQNQPLLGLANQVSLGYKFGSARLETKVRESYRGALAKAEKALEAREYLQAVQLYDKAAKTTLEDRDAQRVRDEARYQRLKKLVEELRLAALPELSKALGAGSEQGQEAAQAIRAFMDGADRKALLLAEAAYGTEPGQGAFRTLLETIASLTLQKPAPEEFYPRKTLVEIKLLKAADSFNSQRYDEGAEHCREALLLDPRSALAHERLGSLYFAMGLRGKALMEWKESLRLNPDNAALKDFIGQLPGGDR